MSTTPPPDQTGAVIDSTAKGEHAPQLPVPGDLRFRAKVRNLCKRFRNLCESFRNLCERFHMFVIDCPFSALHVAIRTRQCDEFGGSPPPSADDKDLIRFGGMCVFTCFMKDFRAWRGQSNLRVAKRANGSITKKEDIIMHSSRSRASPPPNGLLMGTFGGLHPIPQKCSNHGGARPAPRAVHNQNNS